MQFDHQSKKTPAEMQAFAAKASSSSIGTTVADEEGLYTVYHDDVNIYIYILINFDRCIYIYVYYIHYIFSSKGV